MTDAIAVAPFVAIVTPFIDAAVTALVGVGATWFAIQVHRWTGHAMAQADQDKLRQAAQDAAGVIFAGAEAGISSVSIKVSDPRITSAATQIAATIPAILAMTGTTPTTVANMVTAELGKLQAQSQPATPAPEAKA